MRIPVAGASALLSLALTGCTIATTSSPTASSGAAIRGIVHGGQQPIVGAHVYLFAANTTGYGGAGIAASSSNASISLLSAASTGVSDSIGAYVPTGAGGSFTITGAYTCTPNSQVYLYVLGGNPGAGTNSAAGLMAILGNCPSGGSFAAATPVVVVNEVSTVAAAYAFAGFATDATHVSSSGTALAQTGIANAFANAANLYNVSGGLIALSTTPAGNGAVPQSRLNTLANILSTCVNSSGANSVSCTTLFSSAMNGSIMPSDTATAAINIAHNPGANVANLFSLSTASPPFAPTLSVAPNDFTIAISFTGGGLSQPVDVAIDGSDNVWVTNGTAESISEFAPNGSALSPSTGFTGGGLSGTITNVVNGIAVDTAGAIWIANPTGSLSKFSANGSPISGISGYTGGGLNIPDLLAVDASNNIWTGNRGNYSVSEFSSTGTPISGVNGYTGGGLASPSGIAVDASGNIWAADNGISGQNGGNSLSKLTSAGASVSGIAGYTGGGLLNPFALAIDPQGNIWTTDTNGDINKSYGALSEFTSSGVPISGSSPYSGGGLNGIAGIAIDSAGNVWAANSNGNSISEFNSTGTAVTGSSGYRAGLSSPAFLAIDGAGDVWVTNLGNNSISEFIGLAAPVVTPIVANLLSPYGAHAVNQP
jgi:sugar lactone lactonase YvrE